jgi:hypothetical protein
VDVALVSTLLGAVVTIIGIFVGSYLTSRAELDKRAAEAHFNLIQEMIDAVMHDLRNQSLDLRVQYELPDMRRQWEDYWVSRELQNRLSTSGNYSTKLILENLKTEMVKPRPGSLLQAYQSTGGFIIFVIICEATRVLGLAYPSTVGPAWFSKHVVYLVPAFKYELTLAQWVRERKLEQNF